MIMSCAVRQRFVAWRGLREGIRLFERSCYAIWTCGLEVEIVFLLRVRRRVVMCKRRRSRMWKRWSSCLCERRERRSKWIYKRRSSCIHQGWCSGKRKRWCWSCVLQCKDIGSIVIKLTVTCRPQLRFGLLDLARFLLGLDLVAILMKANGELIRQRGLERSVGFEACGSVRHVLMTDGETYIRIDSNRWLPSGSVSFSNRPILHLGYFRLVIK